MRSGVNTASGRVKAASCQAMTILVISLPEKPWVSAAIYSIISLVTPSIWTRVFARYKLLGYFHAKAAFSEKLRGGWQYLTR